MVSGLDGAPGHFVQLVATKRWRGIAAVLNQFLVGSTAQEVGLRVLCAQSLLVQVTVE